jgi:hypothetical protein
MANPFNQPPSRPSLGGQKGPTPWVKVAICAALVLAVGALAAVVIHISHGQPNPQDTADDNNLSIPVPASNSIPELPPEVTSALANPTNLPDDVTPAPPTPTAAPLVVGQTAAPVTVPVATPIPVATAPIAAATPVARHHTGAMHYRAATVIVRRGDTLWHIARIHHTSVQALKAANGLRSDRILVGQKLKIPHFKLATRSHHRTYHHHGGVARASWNRLKTSYRRASYRRRRR